MTKGSESEGHVVRLCGGLGNQLFQYSFGEYMRERSGIPVFYDIESGFLRDPFGRTYALGGLGIDLPFADVRQIPFGMRESASVYRLIKLFRLIFQRRACPVYWERSPYRCDYHALSRRCPTYYFGYWQWVGYAGSVRDRIAENCALIAAHLLKGRTKLSDLRNGIGLHLRCRASTRANGTVDAATAARTNTLTPEYVAKTLALLPAELPVYVFSDELATARMMLRNDRRCVFVCEAAEFSDVEEFALFSACKYHVLSNSTFSWWAGRLNPEQKNVMAPAKWFKSDLWRNADLLPREWRTVSL